MTDTDTEASLRLEQVLKVGAMRRKLHRTAEAVRVQDARGTAGETPQRWTQVLPAQVIVCPG